MHCGGLYFSETKLATTNVNIPEQHGIKFCDKGSVHGNKSLRIIEFRLLEKKNPWTRKT